MNQKYLDNYINIVLKIGLNLQPGQNLVINSPLECTDTVHQIVDRAYQMGANKVVVDWNDPELTKLKYKYEDIKHFETIEDFAIARSEYFVDTNSCFLSLDGLDSQALSGIDYDKLSAWQQTVHRLLNKKDDAIMNDLVSWCIVAVPTKKWAMEVFPNDEDCVNKLWDMIFKMTRCDNDDPIKAWEDHINHLQTYAKIINDHNFTSLYFVNEKGTDLNVGLVKDYQFLAANSINHTNNQPFIANIPTEEVYSMPDKRNVNGKVSSSKPLSYHGQLIDDFYLEFKDGKVIDAKAEVGDQILQSMLNTDEGSRSLGEVALVSYHTPISLSNILFFTTLYDENASCHLALGKAYPTTVKNGENLSKEELDQLGCNDSAIHVDFMFGTPDMNIYGIKEDGSQVQIFKDGDFCI